MVSIGGGFVASQLGGTLIQVCMMISSIIKVFNRKYPIIYHSPSALMFDEVMNCFIVHGNMHLSKLPIENDAALNKIAWIMRNKFQTRPLGERIPPLMPNTSNIAYE